MFVGIANTARDYAWGSVGAISKLFGREASGALEAELWFGAHPGSPSRVVGTDLTLDRIIDDRLPFLLKVLAADSPLSLQAHPTPEQAAAGFAREDAAGIPRDAPERNYRDPFAKPELLLAVSEKFEVLCGFRPMRDIRAVLSGLIDSHPSTVLVDLRAKLEGDNVRAVFEWLFTRAPGVEEAIEVVSAAVAAVPGTARANPERATAAMLAEVYPGDPGIVISLLMNRITLRRGECVYLPAGNIHSYLSGIGIELMTASDNVLRGGLTPKHIDVAELISVLDFEPMMSPLLAPIPLSQNVLVYRPPVRDFQLAVASGDGDVSLGGPGLMLCINGQFEVTGAHGRVTVGPGDAAYASADERVLNIAGEGQLVVATGQ